MEQTTFMEGHIPTCGCIPDTKPYIIEVCGIVAIMELYSMIIKMYSWRATETEHVCDIESSFNRILKMLIARMMSL
jgi:hypothetical protein